MVTVMAERRQVGQGFTFARHETFHLRDAWIFKGLQAVRADGQAFYGKHAHHDLGVGLNMLRAISYWVQATGLVQAQANAPRVRPTLELSDLGELLYKRDPFLEDIGTLWLLHIQLASNLSKATFWYWTFNELTYRQFSEDRLIQELHRYLVSHDSVGIVEASLRKDARCFLRTYTPNAGRPRTLSEDSLDCPLATLGLVAHSPGVGQYRLQIGRHAHLPSPTFEYCLYRYRERTRPEEIVLSLEDLRWAPLSPGRLLCLDSQAIIEQIEHLERDGNGVRLSRTAGLNTVTVPRDRSSMAVLRDYYGSLEG